MTLTPEQLVKVFIGSAIENIKYRSYDFSYSHLSGGEIMFNEEKTDLLWGGFLLRQESLVVELDKSDVINSVMNLSPWDWHPINTNECWDSAAEIVDTVLQSAGINYGEKE
jgi:hypothetical protein